jgi:hypothetical protein
MARKKADEATIAPPPVSDVSPVVKKPRKTATAASKAAPVAKAVTPRRKAAPKVVVAAETPVELDPREVEEQAYLSWVERGCPMGSPDEDWYRAEQALLARYPFAAK